jgi:predicted DNA-binding protein
MISVRLSEEEYATLLQLCSATGARSVSDFTRDAMRVLLNGANRENGSALTWASFRVQLRELNQRIDHLATEITILKTGANQ